MVSPAVNTGTPAQDKPQGAKQFPWLSRVKLGDPQSPTLRPPGHHSLPHPHERPPRTLSSSPQTTPKAAARRPPACPLLPAQGRQVMALCVPGQTHLRRSRPAPSGPSGPELGAKTADWSAREYRGLQLPECSGCSPRLGGATARGRHHSQSATLARD